MSARDAVVAVACLLAASWVVGRAAFVVARAPRLRGLELPFGLALLLTVTVLGVRAPGHGATAAVLLVALAVAGLWLARRDLTPPDRGALLAAGLAFLAAGLPFAAQGRFGILGMSLNDDIGSHYAMAAALRLDIALPLSDQLQHYPIGPHALAGALAALLRTDEPAAFTAVLMTIVVATAMVVYAALAEAPTALRAGGAVAVGFGVLPAGFYGQSSFKETLVALCVLTFAVAFERLTDGGRPDRRALALLGLPIAAAVSTWGPPAPAWFAATAAVWLVAVLALRRRGPTREEVRFVATATLTVAAVALVLTLPQIDRVAGFHANEVAAGTADPKHFVGNLIGYLPLREALGIWPANDYRGLPTELSARRVDLLAIIVAAAVVAGLAWHLRRRRLALPSALVAALAIYLLTRRTQGPYVTAKTLVVLAPLLSLVALRWLFAARRGAARAAALTAGGVVAALMLWSSSLVLRTTPVGPLDNVLALRTFAGPLHGQDVLFASYDNYVAWELIGARVGMVAPYSISPAFLVEPRAGKPINAVEPIDADSVTPATLARAPFAITTGAGYASRLPGAWSAVRSAGGYVLWQRTGGVPDKQILAEGAAPGVPLDCPGGAPQAPASGTALVLADPVVGAAAAWTADQRSAVATDGAGFAAVAAGATVQQTLQLPAGDWDLALQHFGGRPVHVSAPGLERALAPNLVARGTFWPVGTVRSPGGATVVHVTVQTGERLGRPSGDALGALAATRPGGVSPLPMRAACGRFVDGYLAG